MRVLYIFLGLLAVVFRFRSEKRVRTNEDIFPPSRVHALGCFETPFLVKINKLNSFVHQIKLITSAFRRTRSIDGERDVPMPSIHRVGLV